MTDKVCCWLFLVSRSATLTFFSCLRPKPFRQVSLTWFVSGQSQPCISQLSPVLKTSGKYQDQRKWPVNNNMLLERNRKELNVCGVFKVRVKRGECWVKMGCSMYIHTWRWRRPCFPVRGSKIFQNCSFKDKTPQVTEQNTSKQILV